MQNSVILLLFSFVFIYCFNQSVGIIDGAYYTRLDHFRPQNTQKVEFKYKLNLDYYNGGPLFFYINNGGERRTTELIESGLMVDLAIQLGGALFTSDHRYFGENIPVETSTFEDLQYLTMEQSISDIATFIRTARYHLNNYHSKVILWGTGYGATLATYTKQKFPHIIDIAWSSSGLFVPFVYTQFYYDLLSYNIIEQGGTDCALRVANTFNIMQYYITTHSTSFIEGIFNLCHPINSTSNDDIAMFYQEQINLISTYLQNNHMHGIQTFCRNMNAIPPDPLNSFARWVRHTYAADGSCFDFNYESFVNRTSDTNWPQYPVSTYRNRQWTYYQCTQVGLMKISSIFDIFTNYINYDYIFRMCQDVLGPQYTNYSLFRAAYQLLAIYGSVNPSIPNTVYTNGLIDPWIHTAVVDIADDLNSEIIDIPYQSTSADLQSINGWDTADLQNAKNRIQALITEWVNEMDK